MRHSQQPADIASAGYIDLCNEAMQSWPAVDLPGNVNCVISLSWLGMVHNVYKDVTPMDLTGEI